MNLRKLLLAAATAALTLLAASCHDDDGTTIVMPLTLKQFAVNDINNRTGDTAVPVEINDLAIDVSNEDPAEYDDLLQSS